MDETERMGDKVNNKHVWDTRRNYKSKVSPVDRGMYTVQLKNGEVLLATFDSYRDSLAVEPYWWVIYPEIVVGTKPRRIQYVLGDEVAYWCSDDTCRQRLHD